MHAQRTPGITWLSHPSRTFRGVRLRGLLCSGGVSAAGAQGSTEPSEQLVPPAAWLLSCEGHLCLCLLCLEVLLWPKIPEIWSSYDTNIKHFLKIRIAGVFCGISLLVLGSEEG